jgi:hypothetical protein
VEHGPRGIGEIRREHHTRYREREDIRADVVGIGNLDDAGADLQQEQAGEKEQAEHGDGDAGELAVGAGVGVRAIHRRADIADTREVRVPNQVGVDPRRRGGCGNAQKRKGQEECRSGRHCPEPGIGLRRRS